MPRNDPVPQSKKGQTLSGDLLYADIKRFWRDQAWGRLLSAKAAAAVELGASDKRSYAAYGSCYSACLLIMRCPEIASTSAS